MEPRTSDPLVVLGACVAGLAAGIVVYVVWGRRRATGTHLPTQISNHETLRKPWNKLAVHADLPRFGLAVNGVRFEHGDSRDRVAAFLTALLTNVGAEYELENVLEAIRLVPVPDLLGDRLRPILENLTHADAIITLKCCTQSVVGKHAVMKKMQSRDANICFNSVPGSWLCHVTIEVDSVRGEKLISICHEKREQGREHPFEFVWACQFDIEDNELVNESVRLREIDVSKCDESNRKEISKALTLLFA